jgi:hypothetical protein
LPVKTYLARIVEENVWVYFSTEPILGTADPDDNIENSAAWWGVAHRTLRNQKYTFVDYTNPFRHRPFLYLPLCVQPRVKCYRKSRQAGVSESGVTEGHESIPAPSWSRTNTLAASTPSIRI